MTTLFRILLITLLCPLLVSCKPAADTVAAPDETAKAVEPEFLIGFEKYTLDNGLEVILHTDQDAAVTKNQIIKRNSRACPKKRDNRYFLIKGEAHQCIA